MNQEIEVFIKTFSEKRNEYQDPKISMDKDIWVMTNKAINKTNLLGSLIIVLMVPIIILVVLCQKDFPDFLTTFFIGLAIIWFGITLYKRIQKIQANNYVKIDLKNKLVTIVPLDYLRTNILQRKKQDFTFNSIRSIKFKRRNYDKYNTGLRLMLSHKNENITLVDIWNKQLGKELAQIIQKSINQK